jgi:predicted transcriptional regulator
MDEGFILSNKYRRAIFDELTAGETNLERIAKKHHIVRVVAQRVITDFVDGGLVAPQGNRYVLTEKGEKLVESIGR